MTVFVRGGTPPIADESDCPTLASLLGRITERSPMQRGEPLKVDAETYGRAEKEMAASRKKRGYGDVARAQLEAENFMLFGVPIVNEASNG
jgi:hypothetical protein